MKRAFATGIALILITGIISCSGMSRKERSTGTGIAIGAGVGAVLGQAIGGNTGSAIAGAALGAAVGGLAGSQVGEYMDKQEEELRRALEESETTSIQRENDVLIATFKSEILFDFDSAVIKPAFHRELARVADILIRYDQTNILIEGYTDTTGTPEYNQQLSERRAQTVKTSLVNYGVDPNRISTIGYGESRPVSTENALNRRVSIVIEPIAQG